MEEQGTFTPVSSTSEKRMYGPRCILICGLTADEQKTAIQAFAQFSGLPVIVIHEEDLDTVLYDLVRRPATDSHERDSSITRLVLMSGITQQELHGIMSSYREAGLPRPLWATLTPTSETWTLRRLLKELEAERRAFESSGQDS